MTRTQPAPVAPQQRTGRTLTIRNVGGVALFLFGTTYVWLTPAFAVAGSDVFGAWWAATLVLSLATLAGFTVATWGLFRRLHWWAAAALASAAAGLLTLLPYWIAAASSAPNPAFDVLIHALGCAGVVVLLLQPRLRAWIDRHVQSGP